ncbi:hypothetical protein [Agrobacterium larrymoorei]|uniref:Uncharacterized protein n=1 Tax=Agrobacterium larrymoorei TaxID=160699 RepID=A0AAF0H8E0_9HYPH|nr:hypothetical protein [Agrobacterium larrymoorei]WHA39740.1 hypothetical protein CFBP5477_007700 [Agrobacterium larrymoorei]
MVHPVTPLATGRGGHGPEQGRTATEGPAEAPIGIRLDALRYDPQGLTTTTSGRRRDRTNGCLTRTRRRPHHPPSKNVPKAPLRTPVARAPARTEQGWDVS